MKIISSLGSLLKGKALVAILAGTIVVGGGAVAMAAPALQAHNNTPRATATVHPTAHTTQDKDKNDKGADKDDKSNHATDCPAMPAIKNIATEFGLSAAANSNSIKTICALHDGNFKGTTSAGASVSSTRVFGLGEIEALLTLAKFMATHNSGIKLTDANVQTQVANILQHCGSDSLMVCVRANLPNAQPTPGNNNQHGK